MSLLTTSITKPSCSLILILTFFHSEDHSIAFFNRLNKRILIYINSQSTYIFFLKSIIFQYSSINSNLSSFNSPLPTDKHTSFIIEVRLISSNLGTNNHFSILIKSK